MTRFLPPVLASDEFSRDIPPLVMYGENTLRIAVMVLPFLMPLEVATVSQRRGVRLFVVGTIVYFLSWVPLMIVPQAPWSTSWLGFVAPAYTPIVWLAGLGLIGRRLTDDMQRRFSREVMLDASKWRKAPPSDLFAGRTPDGSAGQRPVRAPLPGTSARSRECARCGGRGGPLLRGRRMEGPGRAGTSARAGGRLPIPSGHHVPRPFRCANRTCRRSVSLSRWRGRCGAVTHQRHDDRTTDTARFAPTGGPVDFESAEFSHFNGDLLARHAVVLDMLGLARQIGAVPKAGSLAERIGVCFQHIAARRARRLRR